MNILVTADGEPVYWEGEVSFALEHEDGPDAAARF